VKTSWIALTNPLKLLIAEAGSATRMPMTGSAYSRTLPTVERANADDRADQEEENVEAAEVPLKFPPLGGGSDGHRVQQFSHAVTPGALVTRSHSLT
jgi:hypothetical protein